jgi:hypothetical protein
MLGTVTLREGDDSFVVSIRKLNLVHAKLLSGIKQRTITHSSTNSKRGNSTNITQQYKHHTHLTENSSNKQHEQQNGINITNRLRSYKHHKRTNITHLPRMTATNSTNNDNIKNGKNLINKHQKPATKRPSVPKCTHARRLMCCVCPGC